MTGACDIYNMTVHIRIVLPSPDLQMAPPIFLSPSPLKAASSSSVIFHISFSTVFAQCWAYWEVQSWLNWVIQRTVLRHYPRRKNASVGQATQRPYCHTVVSFEVQRHLWWRGLKSITDTCIHFWSHQIPVIWDTMLEGAWTPCLWIYSSNYGKQHAQLYLAKNATCILIASCCYIFIYLNLSIQTAFADAMIHSSSSRFSFLLFTLILSLIFVLHSWGLETWRIF